MDGPADGQRAWLAFGAFGGGAGTRRSARARPLPRRYGRAGLHHSFPNDAGYFAGNRDAAARFEPQRPSPSPIRFVPTRVGSRRRGRALERGVPPIFAGLLRTAFAND